MDWRTLLNQSDVAIVEADPEVTSQLDALSAMAEDIIPPVPTKALPFFNQLLIESWRIGLLLDKQYGRIFEVLEPILAPLEPVD